MADREKINSIVELLRQGLSNAAISEKVGVSQPTVWAVKANLTLGKYGDKPMDGTVPTVATTDYDHSKKAAAIMAGFWGSVVTRQGNSDLPSDAAVEFSRLLALITSPSKVERDQAKKAVQCFAENGGWRMTPNEAPPDSNDLIQEQTKITEKGKTSKKWRRWSDDEQSHLLNLWVAQECKRDSTTLHEIGNQLDRTPLALVLRLFKLGQISVDQGNELCLAAKTPLLLSETNVVIATDASEKQASRGEDDVEIAELTQAEAQDSPAVRLCIDCTQPIPAQRLKLVPSSWRCAKCQSSVELTSDYHQYIDEGLAGTREAHKIIRGDF